MAAERALGAAAGLVGAGGVMLMAAGGHAGAAPGLFQGGVLMVVQAATALALLRDDLPLARTLRRAALALMLVGATLFGADMAMRGLADMRLFPLAAPTGGLAVILGWFAVTLAAVFGRRDA